MKSVALIKLNVILLLCFVPHFANADGAVFPPENTAECDNNSALVWNGVGGVRCAQVIRTLPKLGSPLYGIDTGAIVGIAPIDAAITKGIDFVYGAYPASAAKDQEACHLGSSPSAARFSDVKSNLVCQTRLCEGLYQMAPLSVTLTGACAPGEALASCADRFHQAPMISVGCVFLAPKSTSCPVYDQRVCTSGSRLVSGGVDSNGCELPAACVAAPD